MIQRATSPAGDWFLDYEIPPHAIAQRPLPEREAARLLRVGRGQRQGFVAGTCADLATWLRPGDLLVRNTTRVLPARLWMEKESGGARLQMLLLEPAAPEGWWVLLRPARRLAIGQPARLHDGTRIQVAEIAADGRRRILFPREYDVVVAALAFGVMPLPPYVHRAADAADRDAYQTVYAQEWGSVAAPTAGLHFSTDLLARLRAGGIEIADLVLHVGQGTFQPLRGGDPVAHVMHDEPFFLPVATRAAMARARAEGRRIVAVGTTVVRALESVALWREGRGGEEIVAVEDETGIHGRTRLFIRPPHVIRSIDALLTNFHLPRSTLLLLVQTLTGAETLRAAYAVALERGFRFFSYGDAMLVEREPA
jgi:S-adenosylmethionine:tRNA ribosyltransferase-isomerase